MGADFGGETEEIVAPPAGTAVVEASAAPSRGISAPPQAPPATSPGAEIWCMTQNKPAGKTAATLRPGAVVLIRGLTDKRHLNGQEAICVQFDTANARWQVRLVNDKADALHALRAENLKELPPNVM